MKKIFALILVSLLLFGCTKTSPSTEQSTLAIFADAKFDEPFSLKVGQTATFGAGKLGNPTLTFLNVTEDSRCEKNAVCKWQGQAVVQVNVALSGVETDVNLALRAGNPELAQKNVFGFEVTLQGLEPQPEIGKTISKDQYRAQLLVRQTPVEQSTPRSENTPDNAKEEPIAQSASTPEVQYVFSEGDSGVTSCGVWVRFDGVMRAPGTRSDWRHAFSLLKPSQDARERVVLETQVSFGDQAHTLTFQKYPVKIFVQNLTAGPKGTAEVTIYCEKP